MSGSNLPLIGLKGHKGAGKDSVASILCCRPYNFVRRAFADELKREVYNAFGYALLLQLYAKEQIEGCAFADWMGFLDAHKYDAPDAEYGWVRPLLQFWGTEYRRQLCRDDYWLRKMEALLMPGVVVTDIRFPNEADLVRKAGGWIVHVERPMEVTPDTHASEALLDAIAADYTLYNDGSLEDLRTEAVTLIPFLQEQEGVRG